MRVTALSASVALALLSVSSVATGQGPAPEIAPASLALQRDGEALAARGDYPAATDSLEAALVADPRNRSAYLSLAMVARGQELNGKAIRLYREALKLEPNDVNALAGQGEALVAKGAVGKAKENLARIAKLCVASCAEQTRLAAAIARGPSPAVLSAQQVAPQPVATPEVAN